MLRASFVFLLLILSGAAFAGQGRISVCNNCKITYQNANVVKKVVVVPPVPVVPVPVAPVVSYEVVGAMPMGPGPITSTVQVPVYGPVQVAPRQSCAWYVDQYDVLGYLFGNPDLVQSCVYY